MTQQFTASEVRAEAHRHANEVEDMLNAFAGLLEAREKAVPVAWRSLSLPTTFICDAPKNLDCEKWQPLYTHPAPSDAERLAEALRDDEHEWPASLNIRDTKLHDDMGGPGQRIYTTAGRGYKTMKYIRHDLAHSAQAQPPAASVTGAVEVSFEVWQDDEMVAECSGPEPSALHEARHYAAQYSQDGAVKLFRVSRVAISAAQENPNGL